MPGTGGWQGLRERIIGLKPSGGVVSDLSFSAVPLLTPTPASLEV